MVVTIEEKEQIPDNVKKVVRKKYKKPLQSWEDYEHRKQRGY